MDEEDVIQEGCLLCLKFNRTHRKNFREEIVYSAIKKYVVWGLMEKIYNFKKKDTKIVSLDGELIDDNPHHKTGDKVEEVLLKGKEMSTYRASPLYDEQEFAKVAVKFNPKFNETEMKRILGVRNYKIFISVLNDDGTQKEIGKKYNLTKQRVNSVYSKSLEKLKLRYLK